MTDSSPPDEDASHEAAEWLARLNARAVSTETLADFYAWRRMPANAAAFVKLETMWTQAEGLADDPDIVRATRDARARRQARTRWSGGGLWSRRTVLAGGMTASVAGALGFYLWPLRYATALGEQRLVTLNDGSRVHINTDSQITVSLADERRLITLDRGEAWFDVAHDAVRPFIVRVGEAQVRAIGTSFSVRRFAATTRILLAEGRVEVSEGNDGSAQALTPGERLDIVGGRIGAPVAADLERDMAWRRGRLSFKDMPLGQAIVEVDRYTARPLRLATADYADVKVNGLFEIGDVGAFVAAVTALFPLKAEPDPAGGTVLRARNEGPR